jgi:serine/threonine protein kinase
MTLKLYLQVEVLSRVMHPNIVTLLGACREAQALVYELMPNGSLGDILRNQQQHNTLTWKRRIRIASNICSALIFLHSVKPNGIVHGDLKSMNILLDSNYMGKLSDFGICRHLERNDSRNTAHYYTEQIKGTLAYMDPEHLETGELTPLYDVYSFGIVLLELVTGRNPMGLRKSVGDALHNGKNFVDASAGEWPFEEAKRMVVLGLRCSDPSRENRPDLLKEVWVKIESMRRASLSF